MALPPRSAGWSARTGKPRRIDGSPRPAGRCLLELLDRPIRGRDRRDGDAENPRQVYPEVLTTRPVQGSSKKSIITWICLTRMHILNAKQSRCRKLAIVTWHTEYDVTDLVDQFERRSGRFDGRQCPRMTAVDTGDRRRLGRYGSHIRMRLVARESTSRCGRAGRRSLICRMVGKRLAWKE